MSKINAIRIIHERSGLGLIESKNLMQDVAAELGSDSPGTGNNAPDNIDPPDSGTMEFLDKCAIAAMPLVNVETQLEPDEAADRCYSAARAMLRARCGNRAMGEQAAAEHLVGAREIIYALRDFGTTLDLLRALGEQHRTDQQRIIGTLKCLIEAYANVNHDERNAAAVDWAREVLAITNAPSRILPGRLPVV